MYFKLNKITLVSYHYTTSSASGYPTGLSGRSRVGDGKTWRTSEEELQVKSGGLRPGLLWTAQPVQVVLCFGVAIPVIVAATSEGATDPSCVLGEIMSTYVSRLSRFK